MIHLINEDLLFEGLTGSHFMRALLEYLEKDTVIKYSDEYIDDFDESKKDTYATVHPIIDIKDDILDFAKEWIQEVKDECGVYKIRNVRMSKKYGFSTYLDLDFKRPADKRLYPFYESHKDDYTDVTFRFSEHKSKNDDSDIAGWVNLTNKTFLQAAEEMKYKIQNYVVDLRSQEKQYLKKLDKANKKRR